MKKTIFFMLALLAVASSCSLRADNDRPINFNQLPEVSKKFIRTHFNEQDVSFITMEQEVVSKSYDVYFKNGYKVEFDRKGEWEEVDCKQDAVPAAIVPKPIQDYVASKHPGFWIVKINRDRRDYEIDLNNGIEIKFDLKFNVIRYDD